jgi:hypothetical protein
MDYYASALPVHTDDIKAQSAGSNKPADGNESDVLSVRATALLALVFGILWFFANYFYQLAFLVTTVGVVNTLSSLSGRPTLNLRRVG